MFTRRFFILLGVAIVFALAGVAWGWAVTVCKWLAIALAACWAVDMLACFIASRLLGASRQVSTQLSLGQANRVVVTTQLRMPSALRRLFRVTAYDTVPRTFVQVQDLVMRTLGEHAYTVVPKQRGRHEFGVVRMFVCSRILGLAEACRFVRLDTSVKVYPTFHRLEMIEQKARISDVTHGLQRQHRAGNSTDFDQIRDYVPGDDVRTINWRATARAASLKVNTYTDERSRPIVPVLCAGPSMLVAYEGVTLLDRAASSAIALASSALRHYDDAGLILATHQGVKRFVKPERTPSTLPRLLEYTCDFGLPPTDSETEFIDDPDVLPSGISEEALALIKDRMSACQADADLDAVAAYALARLSRRSLVVLYANFENLEVVKAAIPALLRIKQRHTLAVVMFESLGVLEVVNGKNGSADSNKLSQKRFRALCTDFIEKQRAIIKFLQQHNINVIYTSPDNLTSTVLQKYLELKSLNAI